MTDEETPITLDEACRLYPQAQFKVATLRAAHEAGKLDIFRLGRRYHTTKSAMADWVQRCREESRRPGSTSTRNVVSGSFGTGNPSSARAALKQTLQALRKS